MLISVHIQKTAGTSFRHSLEEYYGDKLLTRYGEGPFQLSDLERNKKAITANLLNTEKNYKGIDCIHGHFLPVQYLLLKHFKQLTFLTWFRNPVDRLLSDYYHVTTNYKKWSNPFHYKIVEEKWSIEKFSLCERMQNFYGQILWGFPLEYFDFIGITEHYDEDLNYFSKKYLTAKIQSQRLNVNKESGGVYNISESLRKKIENYHYEDMELYKRALDMRESRFKNDAVT